MYIKERQAGDRLVVEKKFWRKKPDRSIPHIQRSRHRKRNHMTVVINAGSQEEAKCLIEEFKKMVRKENHLFERQVSYEIYWRTDLNEGA